MVYEIHTLKALISVAVLGFKSWKFDEMKEAGVIPADIIEAGEHAVRDFAAQIVVANGDALGIVGMSDKEKEELRKRFEDTESRKFPGIGKALALADDLNKIPPGLLKVLTDKLVPLMMRAMESDGNRN